MAITEAMRIRATSLNAIRVDAKTAAKVYREGLKELYTQFLKENSLDDYICHKANVDNGEQARAVLYVKEWDNGNIEIRYKLANDVRDMDRDYPACSRYTTDPVKVMQEIFDNYVPYKG